MENMIMLVIMSMENDTIMIEGAHFSLAKVKRKNVKISLI